MNRLLLLGSALLLVLAGCGGGSGDNGSTDTTPPTAPTVTSLTTESTTPTITGTFDANDVAGGFSVQVNGVTYTLGTDAALTNSGNSWSLTIPAGSELALGTYEVVTTATDGSGNATSDGSSNELVVQDITAPTVSAVTPLDSGTDIARSTTVTATFNEDIFASTLSGSSFTLTGNNPVDGSVTFDALTNQATFTPASSLSLLTHYSATLSTDITDLSGNALSSAYSWGFTTADGTLSTTSEQVQSDNTNNLASPEVFFNADGSAFALWNTRINTFPYQYGLYVNHYAPGSGWGTPVMLQAEVSANIYQQLAANDNGETFAIWSLGSSGVWVSRYITATETWADPEQISLATAGSASYVSIAVNSDGGALAVWSQQSAGNLDLYANYYTPGVGWGSAEAIENNSGDAYFAKLGFDASGNAIAVWSQNDGSQFSVYGNRFVAGTGWGSASLLETIDTQPADFVMNPILAVDKSGNALVVWPHSDGTRENLWSNRYDVSTGWGSPELLEIHNETAVYPALAMNSSGTAIVVWAKYDTSTRTASYLSRRYIPGTGWAAEETFNYSQQSYYYADVGIDDSGNALFFWEYDDGTNGYIRFNRYRADSGWGSVTELTNIGNEHGDWGPVVSVKSDGEAMLISGASSTGNSQVVTRLFQ